MRISSTASSSGPEGAKIVNVSDVGIDNIHVHDPSHPSPGVAFALSRLAHGPYGPTPIGVFRSVHRPDYGEMLEQQLVDAHTNKGPGDLDKLLRSMGTWKVE